MVFRMKQQRVQTILFTFKLSKSLRETLEEMSIADGITTAAFLRKLIEKEQQKRGIE